MATKTLGINSKPKKKKKTISRASIDFQTQSPTFQPNDDELERAQSRASRASSVRRKSTAFSPLPPSDCRRPQDQLLEDDQITDLFQNCVKLASENKINRKNTWELKLIDHLSEIFRFRSKDEGNDTNFQKASCSLEAGAKIYSLRVDSLHSEAYKVVGGINRAGCEQDEEVESREITPEQIKGCANKDFDSKLSPLTTLESSYEVLNAKKFDVAFTVGALHHRTLAQFDEDGAKGLLLYNLGVHGGCRVFFDSFDCPEKNVASEPQNGTFEVIDLSFAKESIEQMLTYMPSKSCISPTLRDISSQFDEYNHRSPNLFPVVEHPMLQDDIDGCDHSDAELNAVYDCGSWSFDYNDHAGFNHNDPSDGFASKVAKFTNHPDENGEYRTWDTNIDQKLEKIADFLSIGLGFTSKSNAWAGPNHWKYQKAKGTKRNDSELANKKPKLKKEVPNLDFTKYLEKEKPNIFAPPKNPKSLLLPVNRVSCNIALPEDCHYRPESLFKLSLLPDVMCLGKKARECSGKQYDKVSKQVDVHALKDMLWCNIRESVLTSDVGDNATKVSLRQVLRQFSSEPWPQAAASSSKVISPHLSFICLLHLANEHNLSLHGHPALDEVDIRIPPSAFAN